jgi:hypothetical protein
MPPEIETATESSMQDVTSAIEERLYGVSEPEVDTAEDEEVIEGESEEILPEDDDSESDENEEGSEDLDVEDQDEDATLAQYLGVDEDRIKVNDEGDVTLEAIVDGERKNVPLSELVSSYQLQSHVNNKSMALENERKEFRQITETAYKELTERLTGLDSLMKINEDNLSKEFSSIDWDELRVQNPSEWSALRQEFAERAQQLTRAKALVTEEAERVNKDTLEKQQERVKAFIAEESKKAVANNPNWADDTVRVKEVREIISFMKTTYGFDDNSVNTISDSRMLSIVQDAMKFRSGQSGLQEKKAKVVPKFKKPGVTRANSASLAKARDVKAKKAAAKKSGKIGDVANLLVDRM